MEYRISDGHTTPEFIWVSSAQNSNPIKIQFWKSRPKKKKKRRQKERKKEGEREEIIGKMIPFLLVMVGSDVIAQVLVVFQQVFGRRDIARGFVCIQFLLHVGNPSQLRNEKNISHCIIHENSMVFHSPGFWLPLKTTAGQQPAPSVTGDRQLFSTTNK